ncbi:MAG TPA: anhydro-N-acetylmuramic acid kinase [Oculatellaceae cyanobacterium]
MGTSKSLTVIGLNSGTSMDGIDAAIFRFSLVKTAANKAGPHHKSRIESDFIKGTLVPFDLVFLQKLQKSVASTPQDWREVCLLNAALGEIFAAAAFKVVKAAGMSMAEVDLIGSHGQTIWHAPDSSSFWGTPGRGTLQLGEPSIISSRTNVPVIADFRPADMAEGGQGAPLVPFADEVLFGQDGIASGILNLGGIANITVLAKDGEARLAFDTGPANMIVDRVAQQLFGREYDDGGRIAASGSVDEPWLARLMQHPYFLRLPPKTTGRELFGYQFADQLINTSRDNGTKPEDLMATVTALTARTIGHAYKTFVEPEVSIERLILAGGGASNSFLIEQLKRALPKEISILRHEDLGISAKFKESFLFALLAFTTYHGIANNVPACTGAKKRVCLGKLTSSAPKFWHR